MAAARPGLTAPQVLAVLAVLALSACSAAAGAEDSTIPGGTIELAVAEVCAEASDDPTCVEVNGDSVAVPAAFEPAGVETAVVAEAAGQNAVDVTFNEDGAAVLHALTEQAAGAGEAARLVIRIGGEIQAAVRVMQALESEQVQISLSPGVSAQDIVDRIHGR